MEQIKAHIAVSLDGHTATPDYELDWMPREVKELAATLDLQHQNIYL